MCFLSIEVIAEAPGNQLKKLLIFISNIGYVTLTLLMNSFQFFLTSLHVQYFVCMSFIMSWLTLYSLVSHVLCF